MVTIPDPKLQAAVRSALGKPTGDLTSDDMLGLEYFGAPNQGITALTGLEWARNLKVLNLEGNAVTDASPLAGLTALQQLSMDYNHLTTGAPLAGLVNLVGLELNYNNIHDVNWLANLTQLESLQLMFSPLGNASIVGGLTKLTDLHLNGTGISDVSFLRRLSNLTQLGLGDNNIHDASPIAGLTKLEFLGIGGNFISNWDFIRGLTHLKTLYMFEDSLSDVSFLAGLHDLAWVRLSDNHIADASPLAGLNKLQYVDLSGNVLGSCPNLAALTALTNLDLTYNYLTNASGLSGLQSLTSLRLGYNQMRDVDFAQSLANLQNLDAGYNRLRDINGLTGAMGLRSVALNNNLLLLITGSPAQNVIQSLLSRGVSVNYSNQSLPYVPTNGTYNGLFYAGGALTQSNSGSITLTTTVSHRYTGKLRLGAVTYPLSGTFSSDGTDRKTLQRGKQRPLLVNLVMQGADYVTGTVTGSGQSASADILGYRTVFDGRSRRCAQAGRYTLTLAGSNSPALPAGTGYGTFTVSSAGKITLAGSLADGTKFSQSGSVSADGQWPLYVPLYSGQGSVLSWLTFTDTQALTGDLAWTKPQGKAKYYSAGFAWLTQVAGARYSLPGKGTNAFGLGACSMTLRLTGGDLKQELVSQFTLNAKGQVKDLPAANKLTLSFTPSTGLFRGRAINPDTQKAVSFNGVILQNQTNGCGYFLGTSTSGKVVLCQ